MAAAPAPHHYSGRNKRKDPADSESSWRRVDNDETAYSPFQTSSVPGTATFAIIENGASFPKESRRRRYTKQERLEVAETRKRGACENCRKARTKCKHDSPPVATAQYREDVQSHEKFALGLTTPSAEDNKDGHVQEMKKTIADIDNKLVEAQECTGVPNKGTSQGPTAQDVAVLPSSLKPIISKSLRTEPRTPPAIVHHGPTRPTPLKGLKEGIGKPFRINDSRVTKQGKSRQKNKDASKDADALAQPSKIYNGGKAPASSWHPVQLINPSGTLRGQSVHQASSSSSCNKNLGSGCINFLEKPLDRRQSGRLSSCSGQSSLTAGNELATLSSERSSSPPANRNPSSPRSFVRLSELSLVPTQEDEIASAPAQPLAEASLTEAPQHFGCDQILPSLFHGCQEVNNSPTSFTRMLEEVWDQTTVGSTSTNTYINLSQSGDNAHLSYASKLPTLEQDLVLDINISPIYNAA